MLLAVLALVAAVLAACSPDEDPAASALRNRADALATAITEGIWVDAYRLTTPYFQQRCDFETFVTVSLSGTFGTGFIPSRVWVVESVTIDIDRDSGSVSLRLISGPDEIVREPDPTRFVYEDGEWLWDLNPLTYCREEVTGRQGDLV